MLTPIQGLLLGLTILCYSAAWLKQTRFWTLVLPPLAGREVTANALVGAGLVVHSIFMIHYSLTRHAAPVNNLFEAMIFLGWCTVMLFFLMQLAYSTAWLSKYITPILSSLFIVAFFGLLGQHEREEPMQAMLAAHIMLVLLAVGLFFINFITGILYLTKEHAMKQKSSDGVRRRLPPLELLDKLNLRTLLAAYPVLTVAIFLGALYIRSKPEYANWMMDAKIAISIGAWIFYGVVLHMRLNSKNQGRVVPVLSIIGFSILLALFVGVYASGSWHA